jgi:hypothetical protein
MAFLEACNGLGFRPDIVDYLVAFKEFSAVTRTRLPGRWIGCAARRELS